MKTNSRKSLTSIGHLSWEHYADSEGTLVQHQFQDLLFGHYRPQWSKSAWHQGSGGNPWYSLVQGISFIKPQIRYKTKVYERSESWHPKTVETDYAMENGTLNANVRAAVAGYGLRRWNVDRSENHSLKRPEYHLWLKTGRHSMEWEASSLHRAIGLPEKSTFDTQLCHLILQGPPFDASLIFVLQ